MVTSELREEFHAPKVWGNYLILDKTLVKFYSLISRIYHFLRY